MMMNKKAGFGSSGMVVVLAVALAMTIMATAAAADDCQPQKLMACLAAIKDPQTKPSAECCSNIKDQEPCLCQYLNNPAFRQYFTPEDGKRVAQECNLPFPQC